MCQLQRSCFDKGWLIVNPDQAIIRLPAFEETGIGEIGNVQDNRVYDGYSPSHYRLPMQHIVTLLSHHQRCQSTRTHVQSVMFLLIFVFLCLGGSHGWGKTLHCLDVFDSL